MEEIFNKLIELQKKKLRQCGLSIISHLTDDDLLQPNDFPQLESNPYFRHNEGVLEGLMTAQMAYRTWVNSHECHKRSNI